MVDKIIEAATPAYKRDKSNKITRYYRCTSGPKKGKLASDPSKCGQRPDPKRVRHGRKVARSRGAIRVRKTIAAKKQQVSHRITQLNRMLRDRRTQNNTHVRETFLEYLNIACTIAYNDIDQDTILEFLDHLENLPLEDNLDYFLECKEDSITLKSKVLSEGEGSKCSIIVQLNL